MQTFFKQMLVTVLGASTLSPTILPPTAASMLYRGVVMKQANQLSPSLGNVVSFRAA